MEGRVMALDVGDVRIGVALSDPLGIIAQPYSVIQCESPDADIAAIRKIVDEMGVVQIVAGMPLNQHGERGPQAEKVAAFIDRLAPVAGVPIDTQDERFSTAAAQRMLIEANVSRKGRKKVVDKIAAQHILQVYLERRTRGPVGSA